jgi:hypothetical protein
MRRRFTFLSLCLAASAAVALAVRHPRSAAMAQGSAGAKPQGPSSAQVAELAAQVKHLEGLVPDQAAVMTKVGDHFTNLYFAIDRQNWPLADFYLGEAQNNIDWAVRVKPVRKDAAGRDVDLGGIAGSLKSTQLAQLKAAIAAKDVPKALAAYDQTLEACYACHKTSSKPYLRPKRPSEAEVKILLFDPE